MNAIVIYHYLPPSWWQYQAKNSSMLYENENNLMYSTHGFSVSFSSYRLSNTQAHLAYLITFFCHLVNHQLPLPYNFLHFKAPTFCSKTLCKIVNSRFHPLQIIHFFFFFPSSLPSLTLLFFVSYPWAVLYLETKDQSYGLFLDLPL